MKNLFAVIAVIVTLSRLPCYGQDCLVNCNPRSSVCSEHKCQCLARFKGIDCSDIVGNPLTNPNDFIPEFSYIQDGNYEGNWIYGNNFGGGALQPDNSIRLADSASNKVGSYFVSRKEFPFKDFSVNATFRFGSGSASSVQPLKISLLTNSSIIYGVTVNGYTVSEYSGLQGMLLFYRDPGKIASKINPTAASIHPIHLPENNNNIVVDGSPHYLADLLRVGIVVRAGKSITVDLCIFSACDRIIGTFEFANSLSDIEPAMFLVVDARTGDAPDPYVPSKSIELIDFRTYVLTPSWMCKPPCKAITGTCYGENLCACRSGWTGPTCATQICGTKVCPSTGWCSAPDECSCFNKWKTGDNCDEPICDCENAKKCITGKCRCEEDGNLHNDCNTLTDFE